MSRIRVVLADDQASFLDAVVRLLEPEFEIVGSAGNGESLIEVVEALRPDVAVLDISMPGLSGLEAARRLAAAGADTPRLVFLTVHRSPAIVREAFACGAAGYVSKIRADAELVAALHDVVAGRTYLSPSLSI